MLIRYVPARVPQGWGVRDTVTGEVVDMVQNQGDAAWLAGKWNKDPRDRRG